MKVTYDPEVDVLRILFRNAPIEETDEDKPGVILDYDKDGNVVGLEVLKDRKPARSGLCSHRIERVRKRRLYEMRLNASMVMKS